MDTVSIGLGCPSKKSGRAMVRHRDTGRMRCKDEGRDWSAAAASKEHQRLQAKQQKLQEARKDSPL